MSWQAYVDDHLLVELPHGGHLESAAIIGQDGGVWAQSSNFPEIATQEVESILGGISNQAQLAQSGLFVGGTKYLVVAGDEGSVIRGKKGQSGVTIKKTVSAFVIGIYDQSVAAGDANVVVENLGDYLIEQNI